MEEKRGRDVKISDIARAAGVSRQAVYLHFASRADLLVATVRYVDEFHHLDERIAEFCAGADGVQVLRSFVDFWGNYIPKIYGLAKALLEVRDSDEAANAAWNDRMAALRDGCHQTIMCLSAEHLLLPEWDINDAVDMFWSMLSIRLWENLVIECGWSSDQYIERMQMALLRMFTGAEV
jgi:AcrR family transcriptional regulator